MAHRLGQSPLERRPVEARPRDVEQASLRPSPELLVRVQRVHELGQLGRLLGDEVRTHGAERQSLRTDSRRDERQARRDRVEEPEPDPGAEAHRAHMEARLRKPLRRVVHEADDVDPLPVERVHRRRWICPDDVQSQFRVALPEDGHHVVHEVQEGILVRRSRAGEEAAEEEQVAVAPGSRPASQPSRPSSGGRTSACRSRPRR